MKILMLELESLPHYIHFVMESHLNNRPNIIIIACKADYRQSGQASLSLMDTIVHWWNCCYCATPWRTQVQM